MAVISIAEIHQGREGDTSVSPNSRGVRTHTRMLRITTNSPYDGSLVVTRSCPQLGSRYISDQACSLRRVSVRNEQNSKYVWTVTLFYSNENESPQAQKTENPLNDPGECEWTTEYTQSEYDYDTNGKAILNSAGDPFLGGVKGEKASDTVVMTKNFANVPAWIETYRNATNATAFTVDGHQVQYAHQAKVRGLRISKWQTKNDISYRTVTVTIKISNIHYQDNNSSSNTIIGDWSKLIQDVGLYEKGTNSAMRQRIMDDGTPPRPVAHPVLLDGAGKKLANPGPDNAKFKDFRIYPFLDFNNLIAVMR
jgi:hypothetical protein